MMFQGHTNSGTVMAPITTPTLMVALTTTVARVVLPTPLPQAPPLATPGRSDRNGELD